MSDVLKRNSETYLTLNDDDLYIIILHYVKYVLYEWLVIMEFIISKLEIQRLLYNKWIFQLLIFFVIKNSRQVLYECKSMIQET